MSKAIFLDRDGTIIENGSGYLHRVEDLAFKPMAIEALRMLQNEYLLLIVTNQSGIGRGFFSESDYKHFNEEMLHRLRDNGVFITRVYHCPHHPEEHCDCRKPNPLFLFRAQDEFNLDLSEAWMVGDSDIDMQTAKNANVKSVHITEAESTIGNYTVKNLKAASDLILYGKH